MSGPARGRGDDDERLFRAGLTGIALVALATVSVSLIGALLTLVALLAAG